MSALLGIIGAMIGAAGGGVVMSRSAQQLRRPRDRAGRVVLERMNVSHAGVTAWGLEHVEIREDDIILDVGCGGGRTIERLAARATRGKVFGIDYSEESVATARDTNRPAVDGGHVDIQLGSVSQLPFPDRTFDLVTAVETHYYWPDLPHDVGEVRRVLKPGGKFVVIAETYRGRPTDWLYRPIMTLLLRASYLTPDQHRALLVDAGYDDVRLFVDEGRGWICVTGTRPHLQPDDARYVAPVRRGE